MLQVIFSEKVRRSKRRNLAIWAGITCILFFYISFLLAFFYEQWKTECIRKLSVWLAVYEGIIVLQLVRSLLLLRVWKVSRDPAMLQVQIDCWWSIVFLAEIGWSVYGNTFIYTESNQLCRNEDFEIDANTLWISALILICWGYCLMIYMVAIFVFGLGLCCIYRSWNLDLPR